MSESKRVNMRLSDEIDAVLVELMAEWKCSQTEAISRALVEARARTKPDPRIDETLELVRSLPDIDAIREVIDEVLQEKIEERQALRATNPATIPGVTVGQYPPAPARRESSFERTQREAKEREQRARSRSSVGDDPAYSFDPEYVQD